MKIFRLLLSVLFLAVSFASDAQPYSTKVSGMDLWKRSQQNALLVYADYRPYPVMSDAQAPALTAAPEGYEPFYISHYGRHGSRWLISRGYYKDPVAFLGEAEKEGMLTEKGRSLLERCRTIEAASRDRYGELTRLGALQHRGIADRMTKNFPEVFKGDAKVDARSTIVIRCILSMEAECQKLKEFNPNISITNDASNHDMYYMNYQDPESIFHSVTRSKEVRDSLNVYKYLMLDGDRIAKVVLRDPGYFEKYNEARKNDSKFSPYGKDDFLYDIYQLAVDMPNTDLEISLDDIITPEEIYAAYKYRNYNSYMYSGWCDLSGNFTPYTQTNLLRNIIQTADKAIAENYRGATLRFGHDSDVLPLCSLMDINGAGVHVSDIDRLDDSWNMADFIPMAANLQFVFYRSKDKDAPILVKLLLNEEEARLLPVKTDNFPYYRWEDVKAAYAPVLEASPVPVPQRD